MIRLSVSGTKGRAFESRIAYQNEIRGLGEYLTPFFFTLKTFSPPSFPPIPPILRRSKKRPEGQGRLKAYQTMFPEETVESGAR
jgi:hypothetical protein